VTEIVEHELKSPLTLRLAADAITGAVHAAQM
jgi:hypothetical protein